MSKTLIGALGIALAAGSASAAITITQSEAPAPTYSTTLTFDEPGTTTGSYPMDNWDASHGVTTLQSGTGNPTIINNSSTPGFEWLGDGNLMHGPFGVYMNFDSPLDAFSAQVWDNAGPAGPFGGGMGIYVYDNGAEVGSAFVSPTFGPTGPTWYNIVADGGDTFDDVRFVGFAFGFPETYMDNASWNVVPAPASIALFGLAGFAARRRRA